ncbi:hypothetical protein VZT92_018918 [Zoarces viviparus]|uniref:Uncharacterized protein n=1 Tax=Zoarces viviparus TaxID=48416 RepID=A0AAW1EJB4_ZOAVI
MTDGTATSVSLPALSGVGRGQQQRHSLTAASEQHGRGQQRVAPELGGGRPRCSAALRFGNCLDGLRLPRHYSSVSK